MKTAKCQIVPLAAQNPPSTSSRMIEVMMIRGSSLACELASASDTGMLHRLRRLMKKMLNATPRQLR
jgi:hypothetical protein